MGNPYNLDEYEQALVRILGDLVTEAVGAYSRDNKGIIAAAIIAPKIFAAAREIKALKPKRGKS